MKPERVKFHLSVEGVKDPFFFYVPAEEVEQTIKDLTEEDFFQLHIDGTTGFRVETCYIKLIYWELEKEAKKLPGRLIASEMIRTGPGANDLMQMNTYEE